MLDDKYFSILALYKITNLHVQCVRKGQTRGLNPLSVAQESGGTAGVVSRELAREESPAVSLFVLPPEPHISPPTPPSVMGEKNCLMKQVPGAQKVGDHCFKSCV